MHVNSTFIPRQPRLSLRLRKVELEVEPEVSSFAALLYQKTPHVLNASNGPPGPRSLPHIGSSAPARC